MKNLGKRLTSLLLTVCLTVGLLAVPVFAAEHGGIPSQITLSLADSLCHLRHRLFSERCRNRPGNRGGYRRNRL